MIGRHKHVAHPCDNTTDDGGWSRTWDVYRRGTVVEQGISTRAEARQRARELDARECDAGESSQGLPNGTNLA